MQAVIKYPLTCVLSPLSIGTETHTYAGCVQTPIHVLSRSSIEIQTHDYAGCG